jgi:hypothetical protein
MLKIKKEKEYPYKNFVEKCRNAASFPDCTHIVVKETHNGLKEGVWIYHYRKDLLEHTTTGGTHIISKKELSVLLNEGKIVMVNNNL